MPAGYQLTPEEAARYAAEKAARAAERQVAYVGGQPDMVPAPQSAGTPAAMTGQADLAWLLNPRNESTDAMYARDARQKLDYLNSPNYANTLGPDGGGIAAPIGGGGGLFGQYDLQAHNTRIRQERGEPIFDHARAAAGNPLAQGQPQARAQQQALAQALTAQQAPRPPIQSRLMPAPQMAPQMPQVAPMQQQAPAMRNAMPAPGARRAMLSEAIRRPASQT